MPLRPRHDASASNKVQKSASDAAALKASAASRVASTACSAVIKADFTGPMGTLGMASLFGLPPIVAFGSDANFSALKAFMELSHAWLPFKLIRAFVCVVTFWYPTTLRSCTRRRTFGCNVTVDSKPDTRVVTILASRIAPGRCDFANLAAQSRSSRREEFERLVWCRTRDCWGLRYPHSSLHS